MTRDRLLMLLGAAAVLATASAHVRVEGPKRTVAIEVAARGISVSVTQAKLDCADGRALVGCPKKPIKPRPV